MDCDPPAGAVDRNSAKKAFTAVRSTWFTSARVVEVEEEVEEEVEAAEEEGEEVDEAEEASDRME